MLTLTALATSFARGQSSRDVIEQSLARIVDPKGEGSRTFLKCHDREARASADSYDRMRRAGTAVPPFAGVPVSIKDLFDMAGDVTTAGSVALRDSPPALRDAPVVARLRAAGFIPMGRTNMTEFAYSGLGINPHYDTPRNPHERAVGRIPGGSSSGAAISVTDGMAAAALGTDTGGSCRIPAALCGLVGFKPTARRIPLAGTFPLSASQDSIGPIAGTVACCAAVDAVLAGENHYPFVPHPLSGLRFAIPQTLVLDDIASDVSRAFTGAVTRLSQAGVQVTDLPLRELADIATLNGKGGLVTAEAYATHLSLIAAKGDLYDPRVLARIKRGAEQSAVDYITVQRARAALIEQVRVLAAPYDALLMPTVPRTAPKMSDFDAEETYRTVNLLMLRNPTVANFLDCCSISVPCHRAGDLPVGLMLIAPHGDDRRLLAIASAVESLLSPSALQAAG